jgi:hypothetical protein
MTTDELEAIHRDAFAKIRANADPSVWPLIDSLQRTLELTTAHVEAVRFKTTLLEGMLDTRLAVVERNDD